ncbi:MAG: hypothetical protein KIT25_15925 [Enhydrobacter sp.]|nr:MAG: hypothetical protein KIT25_15925 [Enhydrobacter sp.]
MNILLVEDSAHRRVAILRHLMACGHRVTPASSIEEAHEIVRFVEHPDTPADVVVMAEHLESEGGTEFRRALGARFRGLRWVLLPAHHDIGCLAERIEQDHGRVGGGLNVLLIDADDGRRAAMVGHMLDCRDQVVACRSLAEAQSHLHTLAEGDDPLHAIVSDVTLDDGNGLSFYLAAKRRFPALRWIVTARPRDSRHAAPLRLPLSL